MNWREATLAELVGRTPAHPSRRSRRREALRRRGLTEQLLALSRWVTAVFLASVIALLGSVVVLTSVQAFAVASRYLARERSGRRTPPIDVWNDLRRACAGTWPVSLAPLAIGALILVNSQFFAVAPHAAAVPLYVLNVSGVLLSVWWLAACVCELADDPSLGLRALTRRANRRTVAFGRWHVGVLAGLALAVLLLLFLPPAGLLLGPGIALAVCRATVARRPSPVGREVPQ